MTTLSPELATALDKFAASDLRIARCEGRMSVTETKEGCVDVSYENGEYTITKPEGMDVKVLAKGAARTVKTALVNLYIVA